MSGSITLESRESGVRLIAESLRSSGLVDRFHVVPPAMPTTSVARCRQCGLAGAHPKAQLDDRGVCQPCRSYQRNRERIALYFRTVEDLRNLFTAARASRKGEYDCLLLFSGGKDSTYALYRLIAMQLRVMTFTFDNGFISRRAMENIHSITQAAGVPHVSGRLENMREVFHSSLERHSTVCSGCFKGLLDRSLRVADENGIGVIVTGLSRGQIADERLSWFHERNIYDPEEIERQLQFGRHVYHHAEDYSGLRLQGIAASSVLDRVKLIDFYRYCDATKDEIHTFLAREGSLWHKPEDCGFCSSNCLINDAGIFVHQKEQGYHNYESPTAWEVRLGHLSLQSAQQELKSVPAAEKVFNILNKIGYSPNPEKTVQKQLWTVYCVPKPEHDRTEVREKLETLWRPSGGTLELVIVEELPGELGSHLPVPKSQITGLATGALPLFDAQARQLGRRWSAIEDLWQVLEIECAELLDAAILKKALLQIMLRHDTLRLQFVPDAAGCQQRFGPPVQGVPLRSVQLPSLRSPALDAAREQIAAPRSRTSPGPLWRMVCFVSPEIRRSLILLGTHEWLADLESWRMLLDDLETAYRHIQSGRPATLPPKRGGLAQFLALQVGSALSDVSSETVTFATVRRGFAITETELHEVTERLLWAIAAALTEQAGGRPRLVDFATSARDGSLPSDLSRSAGFFRKVVPLEADGASVRAAAETALRPPIRFSWDGQIQADRESLFHISGRRPPRTAAGYELDIRGQMSAEELQMQWTFASSSYRQDDIERIIDYSRRAFHMSPARAITPGRR